MVDYIDHNIRLFSPNENDFANSTSSLFLMDAISCIVTEERNGSYELELKYPITGYHYSEIVHRSIIFCTPNTSDSPQPFRVYSISKPINGVVTFNARHISYDLSDVPVEPFTADGISATMTALKKYALHDHPFTFWTNLTGSTKVTIEEPKSTRAILGDGDGCILDVFDGEYKYDGYSVALYSRRGSNRAFTIRYGKNLTDLTQDENCERVYSGIYPYWKGAETVKDGKRLPGKLVTLSEKVMPIASTNELGYYSVLIADFSSVFREEPSEKQLRNYTTSYINNNHLGVPEINLTVSFVSLGYSGINPTLMENLEELRLCDTLIVEFPKLGVSTKAKCIKTEYDVLKGRYRSIQLSDAQSNLARTVAMQDKALKTVPTQTIMWKAIDHGTALITGNKGGYAVLHDSDGDLYPDELLFMDKETIDEAKIVLRINKSGIGFSANGYNGPYHTAWTLDGRFYADFISAGTLTIGGASAESPVLRILNTNGVEIGRWDTGGIKATVGTFDSVNVKNSQVSGSGLNSCSTNGTSLGVGGGTIHQSGSFLTISGVAGVELDVIGSGLQMFNQSLFNKGNVRINQDLNVIGEKNRVVKTENHGERCLSAFETPMPTFSDFGQAVLDENGICYLVIDPIFAETVTPDYHPIIFLTKYGQGNIWVDDENTTHDIVLIRGTPGLKFAWETRYQQKGIYPGRLKTVDLGESDARDPNFNLQACLDLEGQIDYGSVGCDYYENFERGLFYESADKFYYSHYE